MPASDGGSVIREFRLPDLGEGLTEAEIVAWRVEVGDRIVVDQPIVEVETAKSIVEVPSPFAGTVVSRHGEKGAIIEVGAALLAIRTADRDDADAPPDHVLVGYGPPQPAAPRRRRARQGRPRVDGERRIVLRGSERTAAAHLARGHREVPDATTWVTADATEMLKTRGSRGTLASLAYRCVAALRRYPRLNARMDDERPEIVEIDPVHLGIVVQTEDAMVVPVVRDAHTRTLTDLDAEIRRLVAAAQAGTLTAADLIGGTFTLNNYGGYGVDGAVPIINHPQAAMLGVGRITARPWVVGDALAVRSVVQLSLTFDHRVCQGRTAAHFLRLVADLVERPSDE